MQRREMLAAAGAALAGWASFPLVAGAGHQRRKVLYFTRSAGFEHSVVRRKGDQLSHSERVLTQLGQKHGFEVVATKDGAVFDGDLGQFDLIAFYTSGDLTKPCKQPGQPMSPAGLKRLLAAVEGGKGFAGFHAATDSFRSPGDQVSPFTAMIGGEFVSHGPQQMATLSVASPGFPGMSGIGRSLKLHEEWYAHRKFAKDLHVIMVQETAGMTGKEYQRPPFPATWARRQGAGRVWYTALAHREEVWDDPLMHQILLGAFAWAWGQVQADVTPNLARVTPLAHQMPK